MERTILGVNVSVGDIFRADGRLQGKIVRTPLLASSWLSARIGAQVWLKPENWQYTGSFKIRGAYNKMAQLSRSERTQGVITASAGNHAQGVAMAAQELAISALVVTPEGTPETKLAGIRQYGATVVQKGAHYDEAEAIAWTMARESGRVFIHAYEDAAVVAGQGTVGLEIFRDLANVDTLLIPAGGGGLLCGIGVVARALNPAARVIGVQSEASPAWYQAFRAGAVVDVTYQPTWAEGLLGSIGHENFRLAKSVVDGIELVSEAAIREAMLWALQYHHLVLEGSGAVALAYALSHGPQQLSEQRVAIVLTGGNVDLSRLRQLLTTSSRMSGLNPE